MNPRQRIGGGLSVALCLLAPPASAAKPVRISVSNGLALVRTEEVASLAWFQVRAHFSVEGDASGVRPVAGIRTEPGAVESLGKRWATAWVESERGRALDGLIGEGLIVPPGRDLVAAQGHILGVLAADLTAPVHWWAGATWSKARDCATPGAWGERIAESAARVASPLRAEPDPR